MSNIDLQHSGGFFSKDTNLSAADFKSLNQLANSKDNSASTENKAAIEELAGSKDTMARTLGQSLEGPTYSFQAVHDMLYSVDHNSSEQLNPTGAVINAAFDTQNDTNPNITKDDKSSLLSWAHGEINKESAFYGGHQNDFADGYDAGYDDGYDAGFDDGDDGGNCSPYVQNPLSNQLSGSNPYGSPTTSYGDQTNPYGSQLTQTPNQQPNTTSTLFLLLEMITQEDSGTQGG